MSSVGGGGSASSVSATSAAVTLSVSSAGTDRAGTVLSGDISASPYLTVQSAINALPPILRHTVIIRIGAGTFAGFSAEGFQGSGTLKLAGTVSAATLTTGAQSGTAGAGTTTTVMAKPTAAANWTASNMRGKYLRIVSGGGASGDSDLPTIRPILSNTTTTLTVNSIPGMDATTVFDIVNVATVISENAAAVLGTVTVCVGLINVGCGVKTFALAPSDADVLYGFLAYGCRDLDVAASTLTPTGYYGFSSINCTYTYLHDSYSTAPAEVQHGDRAEVYNYVVGNGVSNAGSLYCHSTQYVDAIVTAEYCSGNAVYMRHCTKVSLTSATDTCTATPVRLENLHYAVVAATGTNAGTTYGMAISGGGQYVVTGSTVSGTSDVFLEATAIAWSTIALGTYAERGSFIYWGTGGTRWNGEVLALGGLTNGGIQKEYGYKLVLDNGTADSALLTSVTAFAGGGQASAVQVGLQLTKVATVASAADSIKLRVVAVGGCVGYIHNLGANACNLYPPSSGAINALGANNPISIPAGSAAMWFSLNTIDYAVRVF